MPEEEKRNEEKCKPPFSLRTGLFLLIIITLLIAPLMLVAPPLLVAPLIVFVLLLFALACYLGNKLKKNEKAKIKDRIGDAVIGFISGLFASYVMWLLVTFNETSIDRILAVWVASIFVFVLFGIVVIWIFIEILASGTK